MLINSGLCAVLQAKATVVETEKEDIVRDIKDACQKSILTPGDNRPLRIMVSGRRSCVPAINNMCGYVIGVYWVRCNDKTVLC